ncbi:hypothetical protein CH063_13748 [Colletotrichum higginsianum]|uniref:Uncharacterized protein n=1 Tax=Colletotrichum higginsianum (strain IMI 349063) TaxID=759273 RepID=H1VVP4_COLHI|nr:hypothetical protein CH063_13748 [Colletotrichum higginsianum]
MSIISNVKHFTSCYLLLAFNTTSPSLFPENDPLPTTSIWTGHASPPPPELPPQSWQFRDSSETSPTQNYSSPHFPLPPAALS